MYAGIFALPHDIQNQCDHFYKKKKKKKPARILIILGRIY